MLFSFFLTYAVIAHTLINQLTQVRLCLQVRLQLLLFLRVRLLTIVNNYTWQESPLVKGQSQYVEITLTMNRSQGCNRYGSVPINQDTRLREFVRFVKIVFY